MVSNFIDNDRFRRLLLAYPAKAIEFIYEHYYHGLVRISTGLVHNPRAAEDIVQETLLHVWENHKELGKRHDRSIQHYLVKVVKNKSITHYKRDLRFNKYATNYLNGGVRSMEPSIELSIIEYERRQQIRAVILTFPRRERECLLMKIDEEMTIDQMASRLRVTRKAVERTLTSAHKRLRSRFLTKR